MPRNGGGNYYLPPGTEAAPDTTVESAKYNVFTADVEQEFNRLIDDDETSGSDITAIEAAILALQNDKVAKAGDTMSGHLTLPTSPAAANAVRKDYVDSAVSTGDALKVAKAGDTMTGNLTINGNPSYVPTSAVDNAALVVSGAYGGGITLKDGVWRSSIYAASGDLHFATSNDTTPDVRLSLTNSGNHTITGRLSVSGNLQSAGAVHNWPFAVKPRANCNFGIFDSGVADTVAMGNLNDAGSAWIPIQFNSPMTFNGTVGCSSTLTVAGAVTATGSVFTSANFHLGGGNSLYLEGSNVVRLYWDGNVHCSHSFLCDGLTSNAYTLNGNLTQANGSSIKCGYGYFCRAGISGAYSNYFNIWWDNANPWLYIDAVQVGRFAFVSDYRVKKDVIDLPGMWDTVKALRPISYTQSEFMPPAQLEHNKEQKAKGVEVLDAPMFRASNDERWGFIAHELQETLIMDAATGYKDAPAIVQSPNEWTVIAALTKALQEAMARIEALESR